MQWTGRKLLPAYGAKHILGVKPSANLAILAGTALAMISSTAVNAIQTIAPGGTQTSGLTYFQWNSVVTTSSVAYNATAAQIKTCLETIPLLRGNITVTGGPFTNTDVIVTFVNELAGLPQSLIAYYASTLAGGTPTLTTTTAGVAGKRWVAADISTLTNPTTGPSVSTSTGGTFPVGTYICQMAWITAGGETEPSWPTSIIIPDSTNDRIVFAAINAAGTPDEATGIRYYINGALVAEVAVASGAIAATNVDALPTSGGTEVMKSVNTAYKYADGRENPTVIAACDFMTDARGSVTYGTQGSGEFPRFRQDAETYYGGVFLASDVAGLTLALLTKLGGRLIKGTFSDPTTALVLIPAA
jgi:hypothetical protein